MIKHWLRHWLGIDEIARIQIIEIPNQSKNQLIMLFKNIEQAKDFLSWTKKRFIQESIHKEL